jgi:hypothetical protein
MSEHKEKTWAEKIPPGGLIFGVALGAGAGIWALLSGIANGIINFGEAQRAYPQVVMGFVTLGLAVAVARALSSEKKEKEGGDHH